MVRPIGVGYIRREVHRLEYRTGKDWVDTVTQRLQWTLWQGLSARCGSPATQWTVAHRIRQFFG